MNHRHSSFTQAACWLTALLLCMGFVVQAQAQIQKTQGKVDQRLLDLGQAGKQAPGAQIQGGTLTPLDLPVQGDKVLIDVVAAGNVADLEADLAALGMQGARAYGRICSGWLPISAIDDLENLASLRSARPSYRVTNVGLVTSQGDAAMHTDDVRATFGLDGTGITVGVLSDTFDDWDALSLGGPPLTTAADDVTNGDLPVVTVLDDTAGPGIDEGRAMAQLIYDAAPGTGLSFHTAFGGQGDFALGIQELAGCPPGSAVGCVPSPAPADVIVDDVIYFAEPMFQDGIIAQAVDVVEAAGIPYFSSAGNQARRSYESPFVPDGIFGLSPGANLCPGFFGGTAHDFDPGPGVDVFQSFTYPATASSFILSFQWDEPFASASAASPGSASDYDIYIFFGDGAGSPTTLISCGISDNISSGDPVEVTGFGCLGCGPFEMIVMIVKWAGPDADLMKYVRFGSSSVTVDEYDTMSSTTYGHSNAAGAEAVGAAFYGATPAFGTSPPVAEGFSSAGITPILFDVDGTRRTTPDIRVKPGITAPDGTNTTFFFPFSSNPEGDPFPNFFGTSAAAPHAAGAATLLLQADPSLTPSDVREALRSTAIDMDDPFTPGFDTGFDEKTGFGLINAYDAVREVVPCSDDLVLSNYQTKPGKKQFVDITNVGTSTTSLDNCSLFTYNVFTERVIGDGTVGLAGLLDPGETFRVGSANAPGSVDLVIPNKALPKGPGAVGIYDAPPAPDGTPFTTDDEITGLVYLNTTKVYGVSHLTVPAHNAIYDCIYGGSGVGPFSGPFTPVGDCLGAPKRGSKAAPVDFLALMRAADAAAVAEVAEAVPTAFALESNYPNPFNPETVIRFALPEASAVKLVVYDVLGRQLRVPINGPHPEGWHEVTFDASDLPSGTYFYRIEAGSFVETRAMQLVK